MASVKLSYMHYVTYKTVIMNLFIKFKKDKNGDKIRRFFAFMLL